MNILLVDLRSAAVHFKLTPPGENLPAVAPGTAVMPYGPGPMTGPVSTGPGGYMPGGHMPGGYAPDGSGPEPAAAAPGCPGTACP